MPLCVFRAACYTVPIMKPIFRPFFRGLCLIAATTPTVFAEEVSDPGKPEIAELRQQVQDLTRLVKELQQQVAARPSTIPVEPIAPAALPPTVSDSPTVAAVPSSVPDPVPDLPLAPLPAPKHSDLSIFNPEISLAIDAIGSYSSSTNNANFTLRDVELMIQSNVDQLAHAYVVFNAGSTLDPWTKTTPFSDVTLGLEEAAIETTSLPYGLALKTGQFFADFSRLGKVHDHELPFTDRPASLNGIIGGETKSHGLELSWVPPTEHYVRITAGSVDNIGAETSVTESFNTLSGSTNDLFAGKNNRSFSDLTYYARAATIFELGSNTNLNVGADYAHGQQQGARELASADFKLTWLPDVASFDHLEVGGEVLHGKSSGNFTPDALVSTGPTSGDSVANGAYIYAQYRFGKDWEPGIRYDWYRPDRWSQTDANSDGSADGLSRTRESQDSLSAYLNYNFSEFSRLRLGVSHINGMADAFNGKNNDWLGFMQWSITIGPHKHSFQP